jgi:hypothetical protein
MFIINRFIASHGNSRFTIRLTCLREVGKGGGGAVQEAALALGQKQVIRPQALWDPDLDSVYSVHLPLLSNRFDFPLAGVVSWLTGNFFAWCVFLIQ